MWTNRTAQIYLSALYTAGPFPFRFIGFILALGKKFLVSLWPKKKKKKLGENYISFSSSFWRTSGYTQFYLPYHMYGELQSTILSQRINHLYWITISIYSLEDSQDFLLIVILKITGYLLPGNVKSTTGNKLLTITETSVSWWTKQGRKLAVTKGLANIINNT